MRRTASPVTGSPARPAVPSPLALPHRGAPYNTAVTGYHEERRARMRAPRTPALPPHPIITTFTRAPDALHKRHLQTHNHPSSLATRDVA